MMKKRIYKGGNVAKYESCNLWDDYPRMKRNNNAINSR
jgi:hypothetical protein